MRRRGSCPRASAWPGGRRPRASSRVGLLVPVVEHRDVREPAVVLGELLQERGHYRPRHAVERHHVYHAAYAVPCEVHALAHGEYRLALERRPQVWPREAERVLYRRLVYRAQEPLEYRGVPVLYLLLDEMRRDAVEVVGQPALPPRGVYVGVVLVEYPLSERGEPDLAAQLLDLPDGGLVRELAAPDVYLAEIGRAHV